jgi:hypothetical protein
MTFNCYQLGIRDFFNHPAVQVSARFLLESNSINIEKTATPGLRPCTVAVVGAWPFKVMLVFPRKNFMAKYILYKFRHMFVVVDSQIYVGSSKDGSDGEAECSDGEPEYEIVRDKVAELNRMKAQLAQLKGIMSAVQNIESSNGTIQVCACGKKV